MKKEAFDDILNFYIKICDDYSSAQKDFENCKEKNWYSILPSMSVKVMTYMKFLDDLEEILVKNFMYEIAGEMSACEKIIAEKYGNETNDDHILAYDKLVRLKKLWEENTYNE